MNKMFRERNPLPLGLVVLVAVALVVLTVFHANGLVEAFGRKYQVMLPEAAGLQQGDPVRVSGLHVGRVGTVELSGPGVLVQFSITDADVELGDQTTAAVKVETVLGDKALQLDSAGSGTLAEGSTIPLDRASVPYEITDALSHLQQESSRIDVDNVAKALDTVASTVEGVTPEFRSALDGISRLSATIDSRDQSLRSLLGHADQFSKILADRSEDMTRLVKDGNVLFGELLARRNDISALLTNLSTMSQELSGFVHDNQTSLKPALDGLNRVMSTLQDNKHQLSEALRGLSVYATGLGEVVSSGPYFSAILQNVLAGNMLQPSLGRLDPSLILGGRAKGAE
jgi:phospholipid/cholesterol/gamma-HCH transport system substrate-binding protein